MSLAAGDLNRQITIQQRQYGADAAGQPIENWSDVVKVWANVKGQTGLGTISNSQNGVMAAVKAYSFRIRYRAGIDESMRVLLAGQPFDIRAVRMDFDRREWTDLVCELGASDG